MFSRAHIEHFIMIYKTNHDFGEYNFDKYQANTTKITFTRMIVPVNATYCSLSFM